MNTVIIEDEPLMAQDLAACIRAAEPSARVVATLSSVREAIEYFQSVRAGEPAPDLIFSDIQLGDGLSFSIFAANKQPIPVIFCTAYDEYALDAFRAAGIDYILKPFTTKDIATALVKYRTFRGEVPSYQSIAQSFGSRKQQSVLVSYKEKIVPVDVAHIALFYLQHDVTRLVTFDKQQYIVGRPLEELERTIAGRFYRVNRQFLVNRRAIRDVSHYFGRKLLLNLSIPFDEKITVGRLKTGEFLDWLAAE
jgi:DNA-binding LytR/AlgR family response regulator